MPVKVLLADDAEIVRVAIRSLLAEAPEIVEIVGEAADFPQTVEMIENLKPHVIVLDLHIADANEPSDVKDRLSTSKVLAIFIAYDDKSMELAKSYGAVLLLDKINLYHELVPAIVRVAFPADHFATI